MYNFIVLFSKDNQPNLIHQNLSNSTNIISTIDSKLKFISTSNHYQIIEFNSIFQFFNYSILPYNNERIRSFYFKVILI